MSNTPLSSSWTLISLPDDGARYVGLFFDMRGPALPMRGKVATHLVVDTEGYFDDGLRSMVRVKAYCLRTGEECLFRLKPQHLAHRKL